MEKIKKRAKIWLCVAIALMFISMIGRICCSDFKR